MHCVLQVCFQRRWNQIKLLFKLCQNELTPSFLGLKIPFPLSSHSSSNPCFDRKHVVCSSTARWPVLYRSVATPPARLSMSRAFRSSQLPWIWWQESCCLWNPVSNYGSSAITRYPVVFLLAIHGRFRNFVYNFPRVRILGGFRAFRGFRTRLAKKGQN